MKKIIMTIAITFGLASSVKAQVFVGGSGLIGYSQETFQFELQPTIGYKLSEGFAIAVEGGIGVVGSSSYGVLSPYLRYTFWNNDKVSIDGKVKGGMLFHESELVNAEAGISPSIRVKLTPKLELTADLGIIGTQMIKEGEWKPAFGITTSGIEVAFLYNF